MIPDNYKFVCLHDSKRLLPYSAVVLGPGGRVVDWMEQMSDIEEVDFWFKTVYDHHLMVGEIVEGKLKTKKY